MTAPANSYAKGTYVTKYRDKTLTGLAPWTYTSSGLFQLERDELFHCSWMLIGHVSDFLQAGDYRTLDLGDERAIVIQDVTGELRAFHNVCRHRGARVVPSAEGHCGRAIV